MSEWLKDHEESRHAAVYAVVGKDETVNFVGVSRNVALSVGAHVVNEGEERVHKLKVRSASVDSQGAKRKGDLYIYTTTQNVQQCSSFRFTLIDSARISIPKCNTGAHIPYVEQKTV